MPKLRKLTLSTLMVIFTVLFCLSQAFAVSVVNGSFEETDPQAGGVGYVTYATAITGWTGNPVGNFGLNNASINPFVSGTIIPDGNNVAFLQHVCSLAQTIDGFEAGTTYLLSFYTDKRQGVWYSNPTFTVTLGSDTIIPVTTVNTGSTYILKRQAFQVPSSGSYDLTFNQTNTADATLLLDDVQITTLDSPASISGTVTDSTGAALSGVTVTLANTDTTYDDTQKATTSATGTYSFRYLVPGTYNVTFSKSNYIGQEDDNITLTAGQTKNASAMLSSNMVQNGSFEDSACEGGVGYSSSLDAITDWTGNTLNKFGLNTAQYNPFADNGTIPDGTNVLFLQNGGAISQTIDGFQAGTTYMLTYYENSRAATSVPLLSATLGSQTIVSSHTISAGAYVAKRQTFQVPASGSYTLTFSQTNTADSAALLDNIQIAAVGETGSISGNVKDTNTSAIIANAAIVLQNTDPNYPDKYHTTTDSNGNFSFNLLMPGTYNLKFSASGYLGKEVDNVAVVVNKTTDASTTLTANMVKNGSFEENAPYGDYGYCSSSNTEINDWVATPDSAGGYGLNNSVINAFANNGTIPDGSNVAFMQKVTSLGQTISGLKAGTYYLLTYRENVRAGYDPATMNVTLGGDTIIDAHTFTATNGAYLTKKALFTVSADGAYALSFNQTNTGDSTALLDDVEMSPATGSAIGTINGTVTDKATGSAISGVQVIASNGDITQKATTASDGSYSAVVLPGTYDVTFLADGYIRGVLKNVVVTGGASNTQNIALVPEPATAANTITDDFEKPLGTDLGQTSGSMQLNWKTVLSDTAASIATFDYATDEVLYIAPSPSSHDDGVGLDPTFTPADIDMSVDLQTDYDNYQAGNWLGVAYRQKSLGFASGGYYLYIPAGAGTIALDCAYNDPTTGTIKLKQIGSADLADANVTELMLPHTFRIRAVYDHHQVWADGTKLIDCYDDTKINGGCVSIVHNANTPTYANNFNLTSYDISQYEPTVPVMNPAGGTYSAPLMVTITTSAANATIVYTTDGSTPSATNGTAVASGSSITLSANTTLKAKAYAGYMESDVTTQKYTFVTSTDISGVKTSADGATVLTTGVVSAAFDGYFYIESNQRAYGIRVVKANHGLTVGQSVTVAGAVKTLASGERYINATQITATGTDTIKPLGMTNKALGGGDYGTTSGSKQVGVTSGNGLNNIGLLIKTTGKVGTVNTSNGWFMIDDGSGVTVKVYGTVPDGATYVTVTGISTCVTDDSSVDRAILATNITAP